MNRSAAPQRRLSGSQFARLEMLPMAAFREKEYSSLCC
jgi:hypothetical protein